MTIDDKELEQALAELGQDSGEPDVVVTHAHTLENRDNLPPRLLRNLLRRYQGTNVGRQELAAEVLDEVAGALWKREDLDNDRIRPPAKIPLMQRIVVGLDPMVTDIAVEAQAKGVFEDAAARKPGGAESGIIVVGLGVNGHGYVLDDLSLSASPLTWANKALWALEKWGADRIIGEVNNGGALIETTIRSIRPNFPYKAVSAARGKITRAEPVAALYEQHKVHHVGIFASLEDQLVSYVGNPTQKSPDRLDALVWAITEIMLNDSQIATVGPIGVEGENHWKMGSDAYGFNQ